ncbi:MAG: ABC-type multidrug transport system, ATPase component [Deltaproteobacteria bacterium]|nr:ABC-type multidrug transport system, ATPase component [Deltaproteobacteria bacterium]
MSALRPVIEVEGLVKSYPTGFWRRKVRVLDDISFTVGENEVVGFLGANGAGKTTTIKILNCLAFPDAGSVRIFGERGGVRSSSRRRIGFMPEQPYFYEYLTGFEFLDLCGRLNGMGREETRRRSVEMLARVRLSEAGNLAIRKYSKGMMQRLGLAQALLHDPELVILDEPMSGLDPMGRMDVRGIISDLKASGRTVFFSSHIISDVEALCDRVILLDHGKKIAEEKVAELIGGEVRFVELVFSPPPPLEGLAAEGIPADRVIRSGDALVVRARDVEEANRWVYALGARGASLRSMTQVRPLLEEIYVAHLARNDGSGAGDDA